MNRCWGQRAPTVGAVQESGEINATDSIQSLNRPYWPSMRAWGAEAPSIRQPASLPAWQPLRVRASRGRAPARRPDEVPAGVAVARERLGAPPFHKEFPKGGRVRAIASVGKGGQTGEGGPSSGRRGKGASGRPMGEGGPRAADGQGYVTSAQLGSAARRTRELQRPPVALFPRGGGGGETGGPRRGSDAL